VAENASSGTDSSEITASRFPPAKSQLQLQPELAFYLVRAWVVSGSICAGKSTMLKTKSRYGANIKRAVFNDQPIKRALNVLKAN